MSTAIWKYPINHVKRQEIEIPSGSTVLCIQNQNGIACIWVEVFHTDNPTVAREFEIIGTGDEFEIIDKVRHYIGTWQEPPFVFHLYELKKLRL